MTATTNPIDIHANLSAELAKALKVIEQLRELEKELEQDELTLPMPEDLVPLRDEKLSVDDALETLLARKKEIQDEFRARLEADGVTGYTINNKVRARKSPGTRTGLDEKALRKKHPRIAAQFTTTTPYVSMRIS